ncbi:hypothetical protein [Actinomadura miaoliensis]|uniref:Tail assembly chaperone n=1 Tax=Actinomadura miaoliensis TaxID=430685 RepID=A0ABP7W7Y3_9ACTN
MSVNDTDEDDIPELPDPDAPPEDVEMVPLFKMGGEVYEIPRRMPAGIALEYLEKQVTKGPDAAAMWVMTEVLGEDTYQMLKDHPSLEFDQLQDVFDRLEKHVLGGKGQKAAQGHRGVRRRKGSKKSRG